MRRYPITPTASGLYLPEFEHDACGVGAICNLKGQKSHDVIEKALEILVNLTHRGASGSDARTGDGAGILMQVPHKLLKTRAGELSIHIGDAGDYGVGLVFLPPDAKQRAVVKDWLRESIGAEGLEFLGYRDMHTDNTVIGACAREVEPYIEMVFVGRGAGLLDQAAFERKLYVTRKVIENTVRSSDLPEKDYFYIPSLSSKTLVYKGLLLADQVGPFYPDLVDPLAETAMALVHQRYSTNTFPTWDLAQPFRFLCHNGEINTVRGNANWMTARQYLFESELFGEDIKKLRPVVTPRGSDSAVLDNAIEILYHGGRSLPHAVMMMIPEAWQNHETMSDEKRAFYEYHSCLMEPWDGPASLPFCDGEVMGATLDRNGLRPSRYTVTKDGFVIMGSETGVLDIDPANVDYKGRLEPGRMFLVDTTEGRIVNDEEVKDGMAKRKPYRKWLKDHLVDVKKLPRAKEAPGTDFATILQRQQLFGYTIEDLKVVLNPMAREGKEALGSMGTDSPIAVLSDRPQLLYSYFRQLFAQVTNPPLDAIREELVTSLITNIGAERDLFEETPEHANQLKLWQPILTNQELANIKALNGNGLVTRTLPILYTVADGGPGLKQALDALFAEASKAIEAGATILVLSDRGADREKAPIPALLAVAGLHHHLIRKGQRTRCGIVLESGEPREVHHFCVLAAYGVGAVNPYLAIETMDEMLLRDMLPHVPDIETATKNFVKAIGGGLLKVMSKMGISTLHSYRGAQILECIGIHQSVIDAYFTWTPSRIGGIDLDGIARESKARHERAYPPKHIPRKLDLDVGGLYQWRRNGEYHLFNPLTVAKLQQACRTNDERVFAEYSELINNQSKRLATLRGLMDFDAPESDAIAIEEVEDWKSIARRFKSGAMSYGSISAEAHETLAIAMNRIGGRSNSGEGGEDERRYTPDANGDSRSSAIKQCASGRFGVTSHYLANARELQIKMAQGAKPGEGGQLPAKKVWPWIAKVRHSTPYVGLISPPPHHDIYSIEDLAQLIHDLKNANPEARINVKLVAEVGVGTVAAGVSKGKADVVLISGWDGGTGASPQTSLKHAGLPWELGLAETHQTLVKNDLRSRIVVECDGQLKTGRDVAIACLLGAEEFGFATAPLVVMGCIMMRVCHLDTCPVGVATQNPELRKKFTGKAEHVVHFMRFIAEDLRQIMARLGFRTIDEMVGRVDKLKLRDAIDFWKAKGLDYSKILHVPQAGADVGRHCSMPQDHGLEKGLDARVIIGKCHDALEHRRKVEFDLPIRNINRTVGTTLSYHISRKFGAAGLPDGTITINCYGSAGQSFAAFAAKGITFRVNGDANDYFGKGLSGAKISVRPPAAATFDPSENIIIGNVALYGATAGELYVNGKAGERFCVRNSGATAVVEGVGDHGCEYMTGGCVAVLGPTGRNFAAGMSGGIAFVIDPDGEFARVRCNLEMVELEDLTAADLATLRSMIESHHSYTESARAKAILEDWENASQTFVKVMPSDYKHALERLAAEEAAEQEEIPV